MPSVDVRVEIDTVGQQLIITVPACPGFATDGDSASLPTSPDDIPGPQRAGRERGDFVHSPDFASVVWRGERFTFSRKQRLVVAALWRARQEGYDWVSSETLLVAAESEGGRVRNLFSRHPAWGTLIVPAIDTGGAPGTYRLAE